ncbi:MAG: SsrA-binding protein SmpB [Firmicutes bacterium]|nr:SsrA-binding protein SmpB [Bacillota bacterium]
MKIIEKNKKAYHDYFIEETFEAGIALEGNEVKSIRVNGISLRDSFCHFDKGELFLKNAHVNPYEKGSHFNAEPRRNRKLLLNKHEIKKLIGKIAQKGFTLVPTKVYFKGNYLKVEIGLAKGKKQHDKRETLKEKQLKRESEREISKIK